MQRHADAHDRAAFDLADGRQRIHDASAIVHRQILEHAHVARVRIHLDFDKMRAEGVAHLSLRTVGFGLADAVRRRCPWAVLFRRSGCFRSRAASTTA